MPKDDATWLNVAYGAFALICWFVAWKAAQALGVHYGWVEKYDTWFPIASNLVSALLGLSAMVYLRVDKERHEYFLSSIAELRKVSWPTPADTKRMTTIVVVVVAIFAVILGVFDWVWAYALKLLVA